MTAHCDRNNADATLPSRAVIPSNTFAAAAADVADVDTDDCSSVRRASSFLLLRV